MERLKSLDPPHKGLSSAHEKLALAAVIRKAEKGYKIGPLFANNLEIADELLKSCFSAFPNDSVFLDIPTTNNDAIELVKKHGGKYVFECARMYYGKDPNTPINNIYGITTFELG